MKNQTKFEYIEVLDPTNDKVVERVYIGDRKESNQDFFYEAARKHPLNKDMNVFRRNYPSVQKAFQRDVRVAKGMGLTNADIIACMKKGTMYVEHNGNVHKVMYPSGLKAWCAKGSEMSSILVNELRFHSLVPGPATNKFIKSSKDNFQQARKDLWNEFVKAIKSNPVAVPLEKPLENEYKPQ